MHRPLGRAALVVYAPFSLAVARLHCPARLALAHLPPESAGGQAGLPALQCNPRWLAPLCGATAKRIGLLGLQPCGLPLPAPPILLAALPFGFAQIGVLRAHPPSAYSPACARQFGFAFGQTPAHLVCNGCSPIPPETRKVNGYAPFPSFSRSFSTDYRLLTLCVKRVVLADPDRLHRGQQFSFCGLPQKENAHR